MTIIYVLSGLIAGFIVSNIVNHKTEVKERDIMSECLEITKEAAPKINAQTQFLLMESCLRTFKENMVKK